MVSTPLIRINNLSVSYERKHKVVNAIRNLSFAINKNEIVAVVGESGSGKSTLSKSLLKAIFPPGSINSGELLYYKGNTAVSVFNLTKEDLRKYRWKEVSMVFQSSMNSLNPVMKIGKQISNVMIDHGYTEEAAEKNVDVYLKMAELDSKVREFYPHELSGGMKQRVAIAMALCCEPKLLIADEPTTALDVVIQSQIMDKFKELSVKLGLSILFVTHDISIISGFADRLAVMYAGEIMEVGPVNEIMMSPKHPYTIALLGSLPILGKKKRLESIPGSPPDLSSDIDGCPFAPRCKKAFDKCRNSDPCLIPLENEHMVACHLFTEVSRSND